MLRSAKSFCQQLIPLSASLCLSALQPPPLVYRSPEFSITKQTETSSYRLSLWLYHSTTTVPFIRSSFIFHPCLTITHFWTYLSLVLSFTVVPLKVPGSCHLPELPCLINLLKLIHTQKTKRQCDN